MRQVNTIITIDRRDKEINRAIRIDETDRGNNREPQIIANALADSSKEISSLLLNYLMLALNLIQTNDKVKIGWLCFVLLVFG